MPISFEDRSADFRLISLSGRLDTHGVEEIAPLLTKLSAGERRRVVVDLTAVSFLTSTGIRALITNANALHKLGGRMVLLVDGNALVSKTLAAVGIESLLPVCRTYPEAEQALLG